MSSEEYSMSVEELALALSLSGDPQVGRDLLRIHLGEMEKVEVDACLHAAAHSLLARGWVTMTADLQFELSVEFASVVQAVNDADFSIQFRKASEEGEYLLTYHLFAKKIFEHATELGVVHHVRKVGGMEAIIQGGMDFFEMGNFQPFSTPACQVPFSLFEGLYQIDDPGEIGTRLTAAGMPDKTQKLLVKDWGQSVYHGGVMRVEYLNGGEPWSESGLLTLQTEKRLWLMRIEGTEEDAQLEIFPGTKKTFRSEVMQLIKHK